MKSLSFALALLPVLSAASPTLEQRAQCNSDNCLRQIKRDPSGTAYCSSLFSQTSTITVTPTVISLYGSGIIGSQTVPVATTTTVAGGSSTPTFASSCTGAPTRVSSACACLLSTTAPPTVRLGLNTPTVQPRSDVRPIYDYQLIQDQNTVTVTAAKVTRTACSPDNNYGIVYAPGTGNFQGSNLPYQATNVQLDFPLDFTDGDTPPDNLAQCCRFCYTTQGCLNFGISRDSSYCNLVTITGSSSPIPGDTVCPNGLLADLNPSKTTPENAYYGLGQCSYEVDA